MRKFFARYRESKFHKYVRTHKKYAPLLFFILGFLWDSLTLGRIDRLYDVVVLCSHMTLLTVSIYLYNLVDTENGNTKFLQKYGLYLPLAIQFFFGGLSSAYVIYFSRSVSLSKTAAFFVLLLVLFIANEFLRKRISNKYLQFGFYFFVNFIFFSFFIPVVLKQMNTTIFIASGIVSFISTISLFFLVYTSSKEAKEEISKPKMLTLLISIFVFINGCYYFRLIPPVPLALDKGIVAYNVTVENSKYLVTYEVDEWYYFWRDHKVDFNKSPNEPVYVFTSIFAPTDLKKQIYHRWKWFNETNKKWEVVEEIGYKITGGRNDGFRGYTFKNNIWDGFWKVEVVTKEDLVLGVVDFTINKKVKTETQLVTKEF